MIQCPFISNELGEYVELLLYTDASFGNLPDGGSQGGFVIMVLGENGKINPVTWQSKKIRRVQKTQTKTSFSRDGIDCATSLARETQAKTLALADGIDCATSLARETQAKTLALADGIDCATSLARETQAKTLALADASETQAKTLALADGIDCATSLDTLYNELIFNKCTSEGGIPVRCVIDNKDLFEAVHSKKNVSEKRLRLEISCIKEMIQKGELTAHWIETNEQIANVLTKHGASAQNLLHCFETGLVDTVFMK
ncbi:unnamed protein product [Mytilus coruscus]|uniref:Uncharacterized protein n=1 Tax=Mytilus coruscus TaxID=42192 RepID=A0A6J8DHN9_MYTCO|nr:unnamed protein product [Mytilus coruscus]